MEHTLAVVSILAPRFSKVNSVESVWLLKPLRTKGGASEESHHFCLLLMSSPQASDWLLWEVGCWVRWFLASDPNVLRGLLAITVSGYCLFVKNVSLSFTSKLFGHN